MKNKSNIVIATSALFTDAPGINNLETRLYQTLSTVNSIKANISNAEIWILDASHAEIHQSIYDMFPADVNFFKLNILFKDEILKIKQDAKIIAEEFSVLYVSDDTVSTYDVIHNAYIKNRTEIFILNRFLKSKDLSQYNRLYKISGRYLVSNLFNQHEHDMAKDAALFKTKNNPSSHLTHLLYMHHCMFWSVDITILSAFKNILLEIEAWIEDSYVTQKQVVDLEHAFYKFTNNSKIKVDEVANMGVIGLINNEKKSFYIG